MPKSVKLDGDLVRMIFTVIFLERSVGQNMGLFAVQFFDQIKAIEVTRAGIQWQSYASAHRKGASTSTCDGPPGESTSL